MFACKRPLYSLLVLLLCLYAADGVHAQTQQRARLTIIVRDQAGAPLAGVEILLVLDSDDGRISVDQQSTDQAGQVVYNDLAYGLYIVAFTSSTPDGRAILPVEQQNLGLLSDGAGAPGGFGLRVVQPEVLQLFVVGAVAGEDRAVPMFDLAPAPDVPPTPIDPLLELLSVPEPTPFTLDQAVADRRGPGAASSRQPGDQLLLWLCLISLLPTFGLALFGFWRSTSARRQAEQLQELAAGQQDEEA